MPTFGRNDPGAGEPAGHGPPPEELVRMYLRAQNLEQLQRHDEAIPLYERAVQFRFDSAGPYDRLIYLYRERDANADVVRVCEAALAHVRTFEQKRDFYERVRAEAEQRARHQPDPRGAEF